MKLTFSSPSVKCVLFDLDGTLVTTGGAGAVALEQAFEEVFGLPRALAGVDPAGKTDPAIVREIFRTRLGRDCGSEEMLRVQERYLAFLPGECEKAEGYKVMEGIPEVLDELARRGVAMGLGTGNLEPGARIKLLRGDLNRHLPFGGFGSDAEQRAELLQAGHRKAEAYCGQAFHPDDVFIVGDTERDIRAARAAGFKVIAVATGNTPAEALESHAPDHLLPNFENPSDFLQIICNNQ